MIKATTSSSKYSPRWVVFLFASTVLHLVITLLLFISLSKSELEIKVREVKINLVTRSKEDTTLAQQVTPPTTTKLPRKQLTREEVENIVFEIVAPKIQQPSKLETSEEPLPASPTKELIPSERKLEPEVGTSKKSEPIGIKSSKAETEGPSDAVKDTFNIPSTHTSPSRKDITDENISGSIKWIKGGPRKVIEWHSPEIPPNILKKETEIILTFYIEPSGFVSRVEITKTSGEPLIDEIIQKTMRRIRFNTTTYSTVASVSLTLIPK
ncbi:MAG: hypothetical protein ABDH28_00360 [Brevinematia bacterium]